MLDGLVTLAYLVAASLFILGLLALAACETVEGAGRDIQTAGQVIERIGDEVEPLHLCVGIQFLEPIDGVGGKFARDTVVAGDRTVDVENLRHGLAFLVTV